jgi:hypothetical protein
MLLGWLIQDTIVNDIVNDIVMWGGIAAAVVLVLFLGYQKIKK